MIIVDSYQKLVVTNSKTGDSVKADLQNGYGWNHRPMHRVKALAIKHLRGRHWVMHHEQRIEK